MTVQQLQFAKLVASQSLRIKQCDVEIAQLADQIASCRLLDAMGITPLVSEEMLTRMASEPASRKIGLQAELDSLLVAGGQ